MNTENYTTILLIDDDEDDCYLFEQAVAEVSNSLKVKFIHGTDYLLQVLENTSPSIIFIDLHLPKQNGIECLKKIHSNPAFDHVPVVFWSGVSNSKEITAAFMEGARYYFEKPYSLKDLVAELKKIFQANNILSKTGKHSSFCKDPNCHLA